MDPEMTGGKRGVTVKALKRVLKKNGMKTTGKKATLTRRAKKARLMGGQVTGVVTQVAKVPEKLLGIAEETTKGVRKAVVGNKGSSRRRRY